MLYNSNLVLACHLPVLQAQTTLTGTPGVSLKQPNSRLQVIPQTCPFFPTLQVPRFIANTN